MAEGVARRKGIRIFNVLDVEFFAFCIQHLAELYDSPTSLCPVCCAEEAPCFFTSPLFWEFSAPLYGKRLAPSRGLFKSALFFFLMPSTYLLVVFLK